MKIAISVEKNRQDSLIDQRFGRCKYFAITTTENPDSIEFVENQGAVQGHGAGIKAAQQLGEQGVESVITGNLGPNATEVLNELGIGAFNASGVLTEAISAFVNGSLNKINEVAPTHSGLEKERSQERIFFPLLEDNKEESQISPHFGHAPFFGIYDMEKEELKVVPNELDHIDPSKSPIDQIQEFVNPTTIFAKGIGGRAISLIAEKGISLKTGPFNTVKEAIQHWDELEDQTQSCGH